VWFKRIIYTKTTISKKNIKKTKILTFRGFCFFKPQKNQKLKKTIFSTPGGLSHVHFSLIEEITLIGLLFEPFIVGLGSV